MHWQKDLTPAPIFGIFINPHPSSPSIPVWWCTSLVGFVKINTDGHVKDGIASKRGIIKDHVGDCIKACLASYGPCRILEVELGAILDGILLDRGLDLLGIWVESDSIMDIHSITRE